LIEVNKEPYKSAVEMIEALQFGLCSYRSTNGENGKMRTLLASMALAAGLFLIPAQASAWTCGAVGASSRTATGSAILIERARGIALRRCERRNAGGCTIRWCR